MHETGAADRRTWPAGLAGMIALVIAIEWCVSWNEGRLLTPGTLVWSENSRAATDEAVRADILGLGDSLVMHGLAPAVIEARLGKKAYNLAVPSGQPAANLFLLRRMLRAGAQAVRHPARRRVARTRPARPRRGLGRAGDPARVRRAGLGRAGRDVLQHAGRGPASCLQSAQGRHPRAGHVGVRRHDRPRRCSDGTAPA